MEELKWMSAESRANVKVLICRMKELGFKHYEIDDDNPYHYSSDICFAVDSWHSTDGEFHIEYKNSIGVCLTRSDVSIHLWNFKVLDILPKAKQAILAFHKAEGLPDEGDLWYID